MPAPGAEEGAEGPMLGSEVAGAKLGSDPSMKGGMGRLSGSGAAWKDDQAKRSFGDEGASAGAGGASGAGAGFFFFFPLLPLTALAFVLLAPPLVFLSFLFFRPEEFP